MVWVTENTPKIRKEADKPTTLTSKYFTFEHYRVFIYLNKADTFYDILLKSKDRESIYKIQDRLDVMSPIIYNNDFFCLVFDTFSTLDDAKEIFDQLEDMILDA